MLSIVLPILVRQESDDLTQIQKVYALSATRNAVVRIDLGDATATTIVGEARSHAPIAFFRDQWRKTDGAWWLHTHEPISGTPPFRFRDALVSDALRLLDGGKGREWALEATANRRITFDLTGLDFDAALPKVLRAADAKPYRTPNDVVWFVPVHGGPYDQSAVILSSVVFAATDIRQAVRWIFQRMDQSYTIDPDVAGTVTLSLLDVPTEEALQAIVRQAHATYRVEGGVFQVVRTETPPPSRH